MGGNFDGHWLFKYLTENIFTDGHCFSPYTCKHYIVFKQFDRLNFDSLAGKHQKHQNFPPSKFCAIRYYSRYHIRVSFAGQKSHGFMASNLTVIVFPLKLLPSIYSTSAYKTNGLAVIVEPQIHLIKLYCKNFCLVVVQILNYIYDLFCEF